MTDHYREAVRLAAMAEHVHDPAWAAARAAQAQVHATLALAAATAQSTTTTPPTTTPEGFDHAGVIHDLDDNGECTRDCTGCDITRPTVWIVHEPKSAFDIPEAHATPASARESAIRGMLPAFDWTLDGHVFTWRPAGLMREELFADEGATGVYVVTARVVGDSEAVA